MAKRHKRASPENATAGDSTGLNYHENTQGFQIFTDFGQRVSQIMSPIVKLSAAELDMTKPHATPEDVTVRQRIDLPLIQRAKSEHVIHFAGLGNTDSQHASARIWRKPLAGDLGKSSKIVIDCFTDDTGWTMERLMNGDHTYVWEESGFETELGIADGGSVVLPLGEGPPIRVHLGNATFLSDLEQRMPPAVEAIHAMAGTLDILRGVVQRPLSPVETAPSGESETSFLGRVASRFGR